MSFITFHFDHILLYIDLIYLYHVLFFFRFCTFNYFNVENKYFPCEINILWHWWVIYYLMLILFGCNVAKFKALFPVNILKFSIWSVKFKLFVYMFSQMFEK